MLFGGPGTDDSLFLCVCECVCFVIFVCALFVFRVLLSWFKRGPKGNHPLFSGLPLFPWRWLRSLFPVRPFFLWFGGVPAVDPSKGVPVSSRFLKRDFSHGLTVLVAHKLRTCFGQLSSSTIPL